MGGHDDPLAVPKPPQREAPAGSAVPGGSPAAQSAADPAANPAGDPASASGRARTRKAPAAFRTISEVADDLHIPQHVLRFWETKFAQVRPLKRGGGRRYYRPDDIALLRRIADLLYTQGYTIKGVQRLLREGGGKLADDIPPAAPEERTAAAAEHAPVASSDPLLPIPELALPPVVPPPFAPRAEAERLRAVLRETLRALEALRADLG